MNRISQYLSLLCVLGTSGFGCEVAVITVVETAPGEDAGTYVPPPPPGEPVSFRSAIQRDLESRECVRCHIGGATPMVIQSSPSTEAEWRLNYDEVLARVGTASASLLLDKARGGAGHPLMVSSTGPIYARWQAWIEDGAPYEDDAPPPPPPSPGTDAGTAPVGDAGVPVDPPEELITWSADIDRLIERNDCRRCHGDRGDYSLESLSGAMAAGSDATPNVLPGDPGSLLITYVRNGHQGISYRDALVVLAWIVDYDARPE